MIETQKHRMSKMFCKICLDSGKPESEYSSHFIRENKNPNSKIVCPTLLSLECKYCFKKGHTVKYCNTLLKKTKENAKREKRHQYNQHNVESSSLSNENKKDTKSTSKYSGLIIDSDEEDETEKEMEYKRKEDQDQCIKKFSYASIVMKPKESVVAKLAPIQIPPRTPPTPVSATLTPDSPKYVSRKPAPWAPTVTAKKSLNWAYDSDEEEDETVSNEEEVWKNYRDEDW